MKFVFFPKDVSIQFGNTLEPIFQYVNRDKLEFSVPDAIFCRFQD